MDIDEIIYAVGELYLQRRKSQQITVDQQKRIEQLEQELQEAQEKLEAQEKPQRAGRKKK